MRSEQEISGMQILIRKEQFTGRGLERFIHTEPQRFILGLDDHEVNYPEYEGVESRTQRRRIPHDYSTMTFQFLLFQTLDNSGI